MAPMALLESADRTQEIDATKHGPENVRDVKFAVALCHSKKPGSRISPLVRMIKLGSGSSGEYSRPWLTI
jgi:hypothetical protein